MFRRCTLCCCAAEFASLGTILNSGVLQTLEVVTVVVVLPVVEAMSVVLDIDGNCVANFSFFDMISMINNNIY